MQLGKNNQLFKDLKTKLKEDKADEIITDDLAIIDLAIKNKHKILNTFFVNKEYKEETKRILDYLKENSTAYEISEEMFSSIATKENKAGIVAIIKRPNYKIDDLKNLDFICVCDHLEIPGNLGTILRTCDSANVGGMLIVDPVVKLRSKKLLAASRGLELVIPCVECSYEEAQNFLLEKNYNIYLGEPKLGKNYQEYNYEGKTAIVIGNERYGINLNWYNNKHLKVFIPMWGHQNSLNVGVAASILIYEAAMKRNK